MSDNSAEGLLDARVRDAILDDLHATVEAIVAAVTETGPSYGPLVASERATGLRLQIDVALRTFLRLASQQVSTTADPDDALMRPALDAAFAMGRDQATGGRDTETLLTAFRVGARTAWHRFAATATFYDMSATRVADLAELMFDFIDQLSAGTVAGHQHQAATSLQVREQERTLLVRNLVTGRTTTKHQLRRAEWQLPTYVTVVLVRDTDLGRLRDHLPLGSLVAVGDISGLDDAAEDTALTVVPDLSPTARARLLRKVADVGCVIGPTVALKHAPRSHRWAARLWNAGQGKAAVDADTRLLDIVIDAEPDAIALLRRSLLNGLDELSADTRERLETTLACWLMHRGRYDRVAVQLHLHPQTVRYRIHQVQDLLGDVVADPANDIALQIALSRPTPRLDVVSDRGSPE
jgi:hypothetical protein